MNKYVKNTGKYVAGVALATTLFVGYAKGEEYNRYGAEEKNYTVGSEQGMEDTVGTVAKYVGMGAAGIIGISTIFSSFKVVRPNERALIERFGKYSRFATPGLNFIMPLGIERMYRVNTTEQMVDAEPQEIITKDKLNAKVDAQVYFKVKPDETNVKNSQYNVDNHKTQIVQLARTTLRNIIGTLTLNEANGERNKINDQLMAILTKETSNWGIDVVRAELKEIDPPKDVQEKMNMVVKAENERQAAVDFAKARETQADGEKLAAIKMAEGKKQAAILEAEGISQAKIKVAEGEAKAIEVVNDAANRYFVGNAQLYKRLEITRDTFQNNSKIVVPQGTDITTLFMEGKDTTVLPLEKRVKS